MQTIKINSVQTGMRLVAFWVDDEFPAGEYRLVPVDEAGDKDARIAALEKQLADRSPGVMPECVRDFIDHVLRRDNKRLPLGPVTFEMRKAVEAYFSPPEGHEWQPVDADHPVTAADVGRRVCRLNETVSVRGASSGWSTTSEVYILRPIAPPFVFAGEPGRYLAKWEDDNETPEECEICKPHNFPEGAWAALWDDGDWTKVNADGTFDGGRITGRVNE